MWIQARVHVPEYDNPYDRSGWLTVYWMCPKIGCGYVHQGTSSDIASMSRLIKEHLTIHPLD